MPTCCCEGDPTETRATCQCHANLEKRSCPSGSDERPSENGSFGKAINDLITVNLTIFQLQTKEMTEENALAIKNLYLRRKSLIQHLGHLCPTAHTTAQCCDE